MRKSEIMCKIPITGARLSNSFSHGCACQTFGIPLACLPRTAGGKLHALKEGF